MNIVKKGALSLSVALVALMGAASSTNAQPQVQDPKPDIGYLKVSRDITLRTMVYHHPHPAGIVLLLHGFPETVYAWTPVAQNLARDYEVHAIDWPGYGQSSRPPVEKFSYSPKDYSIVLGEYIKKSHIDKSKLVIYGTDVGALPVLLLAMDQPNIAKKIIVGDFAPFNRPQYMWDNLRLLKTRPSADKVHAAMNSPQYRDAILKSWSSFTRAGVSQVPEELKEDNPKGWDRDGMSTVDAFYYYYITFPRDEDYLEANLSKLKTPIQVIWGEKDLYINKDAGVEFSDKAHVPLEVLPDVGHYPHLQNPEKTAEEIRAAF
jgi:pimeloyl-ACP methyl ester carboxylesterase